MLFAVIERGTAVVSEVREAATAADALAAFCSDGRDPSGWLVLEHDDLTLLKQHRILEIDRRTRELFAAGFVYPPGSGIRYSLSTQSQFNLEVVDRNRLALEMTYPVIWNRLNDDGTVSLDDAIELHGFYLTALGTGRGILDGGTVLKAAVRSATTIAEVEAVEDTR